MGESQKQAASTSNAQKKSSMLDEDIGKDFFSSWKSMSMADDDALDFNCGSLPKGKNTFNFDKLDMDFSLGGDFDKISSFKGSMPDLDFSSPVKKPAKPKESNGKETANGKNEDKQDPFTFSFNFDELDSFDLDSTLSKGQKKTDKSAESAHDKGFDSSGTCDKKQGSRSTLSAGVDSFEGNETKKFPTTKSMSPSQIDLKELDSFDMDSTLLKGENRSDVSAESEPEKASNSPHLNEKNQGSKSGLHGGSDPVEVNETNKLPTLKSLTTSKFNPLVGGIINNDSSNDGYPSTSANSGNLNVYHGAISPQKETTSGAKLTQEYIQQSERTITTEPVQNTTQDVPTSSMSADDSIQEDNQELQTEIGSSDTKVNARGGQQTVNTKPVSCLRSKVVSSFNLESSPPISVTELQREKHECENKLGNHNLVPLGDTSGNKSVHGDTDVEDAPIASFAQKVVHHIKLTTENSSSTSNLQLASSEPEVRALVRMKEKGIGSMHSHLLGRSQETESHLSTGSNRKKTCLVDDKRAETMPLSAVDDGRSDASAGDELDGNQKVSKERLQDRPGPKGVPSILRREKNDKDQSTSGCRVQPASLAELKVKYSPLKSINARLLTSSIAPVRNYTSVSVQRDEVSPLRDCKKTFEDSSMKVSSPILPKNNLPRTSVQREMKSLKSIGGSTGVGVNTAIKIAQAFGAEKHGPSSPSLKRKKPEESEADPPASNPLKRTTESPDGSRKVLASPKSFDNRLVHSTENPPNCYNSPTLDLPREICYADFEVSLTMENDGLVEMAEACARELENICNMMKKKHEEAKETLVRAIVNNNNLLMLNHPIYDEKIRMVQRFATRMQRRELQT